MIKLIYITNPFNYSEDRNIKEVGWENKPVSSYLLPLQEPIVYVNQKKIEDFSFIPFDGSEIIIAPKQKISAIAAGIFSLFTGGAAIATTWATMTFGSALAYAAAGAVVMAGSSLLGSIIAPSIPNYTTQSINESPTYSWTQAKTLARMGDSIPILYGTHQLAGSIIQRKIDYVGDDEYLNLQLALCMGEIEEIHDGDILINNTPLTDYEDVEWWYRAGTTTQDIMPHFSDIETPNTFNVELADSAVLRETQGTANEALRLFLQFPNGLYYQNDKGGLDTRDVELKIEYREKGTTNWVLVRQEDNRFDHWEYEHTDTIYNSEHDYYTCNAWSSNRIWSTVKGDCYTGKKRAVYDTQYFDTWKFSGAQTTAFDREIRIHGLNKKQYEVQITRITSVSTDPRLQNKCNWNGMGEIILDDLSYPTVALLGLRVKATGQLSGEVSVLTNVTRIKVEVFNESGVSQGFKRLDNPAWVYWDILTNPLYGYSLEYDKIDYNAIADWATWCDEFVPSQTLIWWEPRYKFNGVFDFAGNIWDSLTKVATVGRASPIIRGTKYSVIVDKPANMVQLFNMGNIVKSSLKITYIASEDLANEVEIQFTNKEKNYVNDTVSIVVPQWFNTDLQVKKTTIQQMGITSATQAYRVGRYYLNNNRNTRRTAEFDVGLDALDSEIGDVIGVSHDVPVFGQSGRVVSADANSITLDREITLKANTDYEFTVRANDNSFQTVVITSADLTTITVVDLTYSEVTYTFNVVPEKYDIYSIVEKEKGISLFRIVSISRKDDFTRSIKAVEYNDDVVRDVPNIYPKESYSEFDNTPILVDIKVQEHMEKRKDGTIVPFIDIGWDVSNTSTNDAKYTILIKNKDTNDVLISLIDTQSKNVSISAIGLEENKVCNIELYTDTLLVKDVFLGNILYGYKGKSDPPADVENFTAEFSGADILLKWDKVTDVDLAGYILEDENGVINTLITGTNYKVTPTQDNSTYKIWAVDTSGNISVNYAISSISLIRPTITRLYSEVIDNNVLLRWDSEKGSLPIINYKVYRGNSFLGNKNGTFTAIFETNGGVFTYYVSAIDSAGNEGVKKELVVAVSPPPDYILTLDYYSSFDGAKTNTKKVDGNLLVTVDNNETWEDHFSTNSTFQEHIDNGEVIYIQPTPTNGSYEEVFDYGAILNSTKISVGVTLAQVVGATTYVTTISVSSDNSNWTTYVGTDSVYVTNVRYIKVNIDFSSGVANVTSLNIRLDNKIKNDGGTATVSSGDTNGTVVSFNVSFVDVTSITVTPKGSSLLTAVYDFNDVPNPTSFSVYLFDNNGSRVSGLVSWNVKGY